MARNSSRDRNRRRDNDQESDSHSGVRPMGLRPTVLKPEQAREVRAADPSARGMKLNAVPDASVPERRVSEHRPEAGDVREHRPPMKFDTDRVMHLNVLSISPARMHELRERRVAARPLGWVIPGARIQGDDQGTNQDQDSSTNSRS